MIVVFSDHTHLLFPQNHENLDFFTRRPYVIFISTKTGGGGPTDTNTNVIMPDIDIQFVIYEKRYL